MTAPPIDRESGGELPGLRSLLNYSPALILFLAIVADSMQYADADLWGHVRYGQIMLRAGHLIHTDIFSYTAAGRRWIDHEWLFEIFVALLYNAFGVVGLKLLKLLCAGAIMILLAAGLAETGAWIAVQFVALAAVAIVLIQQMQFRPQLFDYVFLAAFIAMLARESYGRRAPLWLAVPMLALWANLHGGFFVGLAALGIYSVARAMQDVVRGAGPRRALRPAVITAAAALATLCNPWGSGEWTAVARSLGNPYTMGRVSEFKPLLTMLAAMHRTGTISLTLVTMLLMLAALVAACVLAPRGEDAGLLAIAALMVAAAFAAARNTALAAMALAVPLAYHADRAAARLESAGARARRPTPRRLRRRRRPSRRGPPPSRRPRRPRRARCRARCRPRWCSPRSRCRRVPDCSPAPCARDCSVRRAPSVSWRPTALPATCSANIAGAVTSSGMRRRAPESLSTAVSRWSIRHGSSATTWIFSTVAPVPPACSLRIRPTTC